MNLPQQIKRAAHALGLHRISTRPFEGRVSVEHGGATLARSERAVRLDETGAPARYYIPREDVRMDLLVPSATTSHCPFKGDAKYWSARGADDAFWSYEAPSEPAAAPIAGMLAPSPRRVDVHVG